MAFDNSCCSSCLDSLKDPKSFLFQFLASLFGLFLLTKVSCWFGCAVTTLGTLIILLYFSWELAHWIQRTYFHELIDAKGKAVLVTGCDSGFGHWLATRLNGAGFTVYAACLNPDGEGPKSLLKTAENSKNLVLIGMNVVSDEDVASALKVVTTDLKKNRLTLWAIVNNAGVFRSGHVEWGPLADWQQTFDINVLGMVRVTRAFLPLLRGSKGRVVNVASMAGRIASPGLSAYSMSKHAVVAFSTALRREMLGWGVKVSTIEPAIHRTPMGDKEALDKIIRANWDETDSTIQSDYGQTYFDFMRQLMRDHTAKGRDPAYVVHALMDAVSAENPQIRYKVCGLDYSIIWVLSDWLPFCITDWIMGKFRGPKVLPSGAR